MSEFPRNPSQIPDIIVAMENSSGYEVGHIRIPASTLIGQRWRTKPTWFHAIPNPLGNAGFKKGKFWRGRAGSVLMFLGMGKVSRPVPPEVWRRKLLGESRIPPEDVAKMVNSNRMRAWKRQCRLLGEMRKSRDRRLDLERTAYAKVRHLIRLADAAQAKYEGARIARVVLPNQSVALYAVPETVSGRRERLAASPGKLEMPTAAHSPQEGKSPDRPKSALVKDSNAPRRKPKRKVAFAGLADEPPVEASTVLKVPPSPSNSSQPTIPMALQSSIVSASAASMSQQSDSNGPVTDMPEL